MYWHQSKHNEDDHLTGVLLQGGERKEQRGERRERRKGDGGGMFEGEDRKRQKQVRLPMQRKTFGHKGQNPNISDERQNGKGEEKVDNEGLRNKVQK